VARLILLAALLISQPVAAGDHSVDDQKIDAPEIALKDLGGRAIQLRKYRGKVVLINFWATWCAPCRAEMPELVRWQKEFKNQGLQIIGVNYPPENLRRVRSVVKRLKINYPILLGTRKVAALYDVAEVLPVTIVVDREGKVRDRILGIIDFEEFKQKIKPLLTFSGKRAG
jgi:thiol-disulfide isomerase/thioredoxin